MSHRPPAAPEPRWWRSAAAEGAALAAAVVVALVWASGPSGASYERVWGTVVGGHDLATWVADGPMTVFFLAIGAELVVELVEGRLSSRRSAVVPVAAALGGMVVPALVYLLVAGGTPAAPGWGIPMATDVAIAVGVVTAAGARVPPAVRVLVLALAVVDDIGAVLVIAVAYGDGLVGWRVVLAAVGVAVFAVLARRRAAAPLLVLVGAGVWLATLGSGVHPTLAGAALGLALPVAAARRLGAALRPWAALVVVPLFALSHAGVDLSGPAPAAAGGSAAAWGSGLGLAVGKPVGVVAGVAAVLLLGGRLPEGLRWGHVVGVGAVAGVGFTVSLFVADLAFDDVDLVDEATIGVLAGSVVSAVIGVVVLRVASRRRLNRPTASPGRPPVGAGTRRRARPTRWWGSG